jgi:ABC-type polar amino acid transport system ATPase subunit
MTGARSGQTILRLAGVEKAFGPVKALCGVDLDVQEGEVVVILGSSGSGKSTVLRCVHQLEPIDAGAMYFDGELLGYEHRRGALRARSASALRRQRQHMGMVFQQFNLFPHLTVLQNIIEAPRHVRGLSRREAEAKAAALLDQVGLSDKRDAYPRHLSGGQQQRVAIARALAMEPRLMLFDEPTSALDPELVGEVLGAMRRLAVSGMTMVVVTHEIEFAREVADRVVFMEQGRVAASGSVSEMLDNPSLPRLRTFLAPFRKRVEAANDG